MLMLILMRTLTLTLTLTLKRRWRRPGNLKEDKVRSTDLRLCFGLRRGSAEE
jgi:hypothetical protein